MGKVYEALHLAHSDPRGIDLSGHQVEECMPVDSALVPDVVGKVWIIVDKSEEAINLFWDRSATGALK